ncbi:MAG TPA: hypothetical protein VHL11_01075, partial [Phototrophicaceae bacterium]|nr:hypothetical protein [Phototrophicaceae bacterium]
KQLLDNLQEQHKPPLVQIVVRPEVIQLEMGKPQTVQVRVRPENTPSAFYELQASPGPGMDDSWCVLPAGKTIDAGETKMFDFSITAPIFNIVAGQKYELILKVVAKDQPAAQELPAAQDQPPIPTAYQVLKISVVPFMRFNIMLDPGEISHRRRNRAALVITNSGNYTETFTIVPEMPDRLALRPEDNEIKLDAGQSRKVKLRFYPTRDAFKDTRLLFHISVKARSGMTERIHGSYLLPRRRRIPVWFLLLLLLVVVVIATWALTGNDPIAQFNFVRKWVLDFWTNLSHQLARR